MILFINGFLRILTYILKKYPGSVIQPRRISQDMLEGLFGTIRELGGDSSTQTLKSYGHALNKYQVITLVLSEIKSINYGKAEGIGTGITILLRRYISSNYYLIHWYIKILKYLLIIRDYRKDKKKSLNDEENNYQKHFTHLEKLPSFSHCVFKSLFTDNLIMGKINIPLETYNENVDQDNLRIFHL